MFVIAPTVIGNMVQPLQHTFDHEIRRVAVIGAGPSGVSPLSSNITPSNITQPSEDSLSSYQQSAI